MYLKKQQGKGLFNFMAGSIVALGAIAAVLFTLDKNSARDFKQPQLAEHNKPAAPEVLSPHAGASSGPAPTIEPAVSDEKQPALRQAPSARHNETVKTDTLTVQAASESIAKPVPPVKPRTETVQNKPKPAAQDGEGAKTTNTDVTTDDVQPTAEQILNSGNLEKAREVAQREARERRARQAAVAREKAAQAANSANKHAAEEKPVSTAKPVPAEKTAAAEKPATAPKTAPASNKNTAAAESKPAAAENASASGKASVQAGAYNNRQAADEQRAKLAAMGVQTKVVTVQSNGKTVYRVQTNQMNSTQANQIKQRLQSKGVDSITRNQ
jgi:hypothetical protein